MADYGQNDIHYNIENDEDKDERITVYLNAHDREALEQYRMREDQTISDAAGDLIRDGLERDRMMQMSADEVQPWIVC